MADTLGTQLTANVLGLDPADVRRVVKWERGRAVAAMPRESIVCVRRTCRGSTDLVGAVHSWGRSRREHRTGISRDYRL